MVTQDGLVTRRKRVARMVRALNRTYGGAAWLADRGLSDPLESMVNTILSQSTTNANRERGYEGLRKAFDSWEAVSEAPVADVEEAIRPAGLATQKAAAIQGLLRWLRDTRGELSLDFVREMEEDAALAMLLDLKGIGVKTICVVLAFACGKDVCAVDTHVLRIAVRMGLVDPRCGRERAHTELAALIPKGKARGFHLDLIDFGRNVCTARSPRCASCMFRGECDYPSKTVAQ